MDENLDSLIDGLTPEPTELVSETSTVAHGLRSSRLRSRHRTGVSDDPSNPRDHGAQKHEHHSESVSEGNDGGWNPQDERKWNILLNPLLVIRSTVGGRRSTESEVGAAPGSLHRNSFPSVEYCVELALHEKIHPRGMSL